MGKNGNKAFAAILCAAAVGAGLAACADRNDVSNRFYTYDGASITVSGKAGSAITFPAVSRDGYALDGWYTTSNFSGEPVTQATFQKGASYYAKWSPVYEVEFDLDGGSFTSSTALPLELRAGEVVYDHVQNYVPTNGDLQFGGWFIGDEALSQTYLMTQYGVTLTAKYKAAYTVNAYLQNEDLNGYTLHTAYLTGYDYVDEEFTVPAIEGYSLADSDADQFPIEISENSADNVFDLHFDRLSYNVVYNANYPDGSDDVVIETRYHGAKYELPTDTYEYDGYRLIGWATAADAAPSDILSGEYSVTHGTVLYAVWNRGYTDMFGGSDYIYVSPFGDGKATLSRGGVDIDGTYDERRDVYTFAGDDGYMLRAKVVKDSGAFVYYSDRQGSVYYLYRNGAIDEHYQLSLDRTNEVQYYGTASGDRFEKTGTYTINDTGIYVAKFDDGTEFEFLTGTAMDGTDRAIFRIRGSEYEYGPMGMRGQYYPVMVLDGFGNVMYIANATANEAYYTYTIEKDGDKEIITLVTPARRMAVRIFDYNGTYGYEQYSAALDNAYTDGTRTLTTDGCSNATYTDGAATVSGTFTAEQSVFGGYVITVTSATRTYLFRIYDEEGEGDGDTAHRLTVLGNDYAEYRYLDSDGALGNEPYLVINGNNTAALYEQHDGELALVSSGSFVRNGDSYLYTVSGEIAEWSENKYTSLVVNLDTQSSSYKVYYRLSATDGSGTTDYTTVYTGANGSTLTVASAFAFYNDGTTTVTGVYNDRTTYVAMQSGASFYYFALDKDNMTFERLTRAPAVLTYRSAAGVSSTSTTLTVTGRALEGGRFEAIHAVRASGSTTLTHGAYTAVEATGLGVDASVCTFTSDDGELTFKFLMVVINNNNYFVYYDVDQTVELVTYTEASENGDELDDSLLVLTDRKTAGDVNIVEYRSGDDVTDGTCTVRELTLYGTYRFDIYTFTSVDGNTVIEFTLVNSYFRRCDAVESFTSLDGGKLDIDGRVHVGRYTDGAGNEIDAGYLIFDNIVDEDDRAVMMLIDGEPVYFDLNTAAKTFVRRGAEAGAYMMFDNTFAVGKTVTLDGHGHARLTAGDAEPVSGTYTQEDGLFTVAFGDDVYTGRLGTVTVNNTEYNAFDLVMPGIAGSYINKADLSVLVLDDVGNIVKYGSRGVADNGTYVRIDDNTFYYVNDDSTDAAMYTVTESGVVVGANYSATYYSDNFGSIVFHRSGALVINNADVVYFTYDSATRKIYTYAPSDAATANKYGFVKEEFTVTDNTVTYDDVVYTYFDGKYMEFTDADGNKLEFMPTGDAAFTVDATYTAAGAAEGDDGYQVSVGYDEDGNVIVSMTDVEQTRIAGSYNTYKMVAGAYLDISLNNKTFAANADEMEYAVVAYDYQYMVVLATYDMDTAIGQLYAQMYFGQINIVGTRNQNGAIEYDLSGQINAIAPSGRRSVSFEHGTLSQAGYYNSNYGNMFTAEFVGNDGNTYHMNFFLVQSGIDGMCIYLVYSCTRVTDSITLDDGSVIYSEQFIYTSGFEIPKGDGTNYEVGDEYYPTLKYRGNIICSVECEELDDATWRFMSRVFAGDRYADYYYYYTFTRGDDESITPVSVVRRAAYTVSAGGEDSVRVITSSTTDVDGIYDIMYMVYGGQTVDVASCVNNGDGSFTATAADGSVYTVTFTATTEDEVTTITATITPVE